MAIRRTWAVLLASAIFSMDGHAQVPTHQGLTFNSDGALRDNQIHWPKGFEPEQADLFAHNEIDIQAGCDIAFSDLADAEAWPSWYSNSKDVKVLNTPDHRLRKNARISWETFGFHIESRVWEFKSNSRLGWFGDGKDVHAYHTFLLTKVPEGCHVVTEEVVKGPGAIQFREQQPNAMREGHQLWLTTLKDRSEKH
jgi:uncharacterized membrane protein